MPFLNIQDQPLALVVAIFVGAGIIVWVGGVWLTKVLDAIAEKTGLGRLFVGMLILGGITSLPELANVIAASANGVPQLAVNNLLGSAAINIVLLALADAFIGRDGASSVVADPATLMMCALCMLVLAVVAIAIEAGDIAIFGIGLWSVVITSFSVAAFALAASYSRRAPWTLRGRGFKRAAPPPEAAAPLYRLIAIGAVSAAAIFAAGYVLSSTGESIAERTELGASFVGFMLIGIATSMPELSTIVTALKRRRHEMAFGQVLGTNFINLSLFVVADLFYGRGPVIGELGQFEVVLALLGLVLIGVFLIGLLERRDATLLRMGYDSFAVITIFLAGSGLLYAIR